ncbi:hypothetical protein WH47_11941 [Habropoda laboriosa]|uniref:Uncharacterized protein n=1 Tax=Habropoda laboriosa TaxID=597456 RepID=A0A0L7R7M4_9HYME|nr:hypothetical protein WH47_11941 [Habropoda laboriosa]
MESSTWCTRRLAGNNATSRPSTTSHPVNLCSSSSSSNRIFEADTNRCPTDISADVGPVTCHCHCPSTRSSAAEYEGPFRSLSSSLRSNQSSSTTLCDLCERLRGGSWDYRASTKERSTVERFVQTGRGHGVVQEVVRRGDHGMTLSRMKESDRFERAASSLSSYASSVVRWRLETRQMQTLAWTILFLLVLAFPALADMQKGGSKGSSNEDRGESSFLRLFFSFFLFLLMFRTLEFTYLEKATRGFNRLFIAE